MNNMETQVDYESMNRILGSVVMIGKTIDDWDTRMMDPYISMFDRTHGVEYAEKWGRELVDIVGDETLAVFSHNVEPVVMDDGRVIDGIHNVAVIFPGSLSAVAYRLWAHLFDDE